MSEALNDKVAVVTGGTAGVGQRREYWVGWPAMKTIIGACFLPALADWLAARRADDPAAVAERGSADGGKEPARKSSPDASRAGR